MKKIILALFFVVIFSSISYADISINDMDFLLDEEASVDGTKETGVDNRDQPSGIDTAEKKGESENIAKPSVVSENLGLVIVGAVCGIFFLAILYLLYVKTKKLAEEAQVSKDLAEKHYFNTKEHFENHEEIRKDVESKLDSIDKRIDASLSLKIKELDRKIDSIINDTIEKVQKKRNADSTFREFVEKGNDNLVFKEEINEQESTKNESNVINDDISEIITSVEKVFDESKEKTKNSDSDSLNKFIFTNENTGKVESNLDKLGKTYNGSNVSNRDGKAIDNNLGENNIDTQKIEKPESELSILGALLTDGDDNGKTVDTKPEIDVLDESRKDDKKTGENCNTYGSILDAKSLEDLRATEFAVLNTINNENIPEKILAEEEKNRKQIIDIIASVSNGIKS